MSRLTDGMAGLIERPVVLNTPVTRMETMASGVELTDATGKIWRAGYAVCTVPLTLLRTMDIVPALPPTQSAAVQANTLRRSRGSLLRCAGTVLGGRRAAAFTLDGQRTGPCAAPGRRRHQRMPLAGHSRAGERKNPRARRCRHHGPHRCRTRTRAAEHRGQDQTDDSAQLVGVSVDPRPCRLSCTGADSGLWQRGLHCRTGGFILRVNIRQWPRSAWRARWNPANVLPSNYCREAFKRRSLPMTARSNGCARRGRIRRNFPAPRAIRR